MKILYKCIIGSRFYNEKPSVVYLIAENYTDAQKQAEEFEAERSNSPIGPVLSIEQLASDANIDPNQLYLPDHYDNRTTN
jgi:hypothetical protein